MKNQCSPSYPSFSFPFTSLVVQEKLKISTFFSSTIFFPPFSTHPNCWSWDTFICMCVYYIRCLLFLKDICNVYIVSCWQSYLMLLGSACFRINMSRSSRTLYVGNLPGDIREREVEDLFYKVFSKTLFLCFV